MAKEKRVIPPYVPYRTFRNFIDGLKPVPPVIDRGVIKNMGGSLQSQLLATLKYLQLIDENSNKTSDDLRELTTLRGDERAIKLKQILERAYPYFFPNDRSFDLAEGTNSQFSQILQKQGASGDTIRKCGKYFLDAAKDAGIRISKYISPQKAINNTGDIKTRKPIKKRIQTQKPGNEDPGIPVNNWYLVFKNAFDLLPDYSEKPKPHWSNEEKNNFINLVTAIIIAFIELDEKRR